MPQKVLNFRKTGDTVLHRIAELPAELRQAVHAPLQGFTALHAKYTGLCDAADAGREKRDAALKVVSTADKTMDAAMQVLADKLAGAGLGKRQNPFKAFSPHTPSALAVLATDKQVPALRALCQAVSAAEPPPDVAKAVKACLQAVDAFEKAGAALAKPQAAFQMAMAQRDALLVEWQRELNRLKRHAEAAWFDHPGTWKAVFGR